MSFKNTVSLNHINKLWVRIIVLLIIFFILVASASRLYTTKEVKKGDSLDDFTVYLDQRIPVLMKEYDIPGVNIALVQKGKTTWTKAYGYADLEKGRKMTVDTYCRVESISKPVTAWGVMKLVEQGKIELDRPVVQYIKNWKFPESKYSVERMTVRQLLSHSAGMPIGNFMDRFSPNDKMPSLQESLYEESVLMQEPGLSFSYSDTGFNLLELLIEEVTGRDFAEYMQKEVLIPLGMYRSSFNWSENFNPAVPVAYDLKGTPIPVYIYPKKASGGLFASVEDIAGFVTAGMTNFSRAGNQVLTSQSINELYTPMVNIPGFYGLAFDSYGLGHFIESLHSGKQAVSHGGQGCGWMTHFHSVPESGDGIVIFANSQRSWPFFAYILSDWAKWSGFGSVGFGKIIWAQKALWVLIGLTLLIIIWQIWRLGQGLFSGRRRFAPLSKESRLLRSFEFSLSVILISCLLWAIDQDYLFISSIFPTASGWIGFLILFSAVVSLLLALFPSIEDKIKNDC